MTSRGDENNAAFSLSPHHGRGENGSASEEATRSDSALPPGVEAASLRALKEALSEVPHGEKSALVHVQRVAPKLADDDHLLAFLRGEDHDVQLALKRLLRYWTHRYEIFGPEKYALPMTLSGAMSGQLRPLRDGYLTLLPVCDEVGRSIIYIKHVQPPPQAEEKLRMFWYLLHIAMQNPAALRKGYIILADSRFRKDGFDPGWVSKAAPVANCCFPIRWKTVHICHNNAAFPFFGQAVKTVLSREQMRSFFLHSGTEERVLQTLSEYGLPKHCVPEGLGGTLHVSTDSFVQDRLAIEGRDLELKGNIRRSRSPSGEYYRGSNHDTEDEVTGNDTCSFYHAKKTKLHQDAGSFAAENPSALTVPDHIKEIRAETEERKGLPMPATSLGHRQLEDNMANTDFAKNSFTSLVQHETLAESDNSIQVEHDSSKSNSLGIDVPSEKQPPDQSAHKSSQPDLRGDGRSETRRKRSHSAANAARAGNPTHGRSGDPRMNRAVQAKVDNPDLSLVEALVAGGFAFPDLSGPGVNVGAALDEDGVSVYQRRNQLMRRLRYMNKKSRAK